MRSLPTCPLVDAHLPSPQAFANYLAYKRDNNELLLFVLRQLASDQLTFNRNRYGGEMDIIEVPEEEFVEKVHASREFGCTQLSHIHSVVHV